MRKTIRMDMCEGPLFKKIISFTVPIILSGLLQLTFNAADMIVVGQFSGSKALGAVGATGTLVNLLVNLFMGLSIGSGVAVAHAVGAKDDSMVFKTVHTTIPVALGSGVIISLVGVLGANQFLQWMGAPADVLPLATLYLRLYLSGAVFSMLYNFGAAILRAAGDTKSPLVYLTVAGVSNVLLNLVLVVGFQMSVAGVALATVASQIISSALVLRNLMRRSDNCKFLPKKMCIKKEPLLKILRVGLPTGIQSSMFSIANVIVQSAVNSFGSIAISGVSAAANIEGFVYTVMHSFCQTAMNFTGQNMGAKKYDRVKKICIICVSCAAVSGIALGGLAYLFGRPLLAVYISDSASAINYGLERLSRVGLLYFMCGMMESFSGTLRGMGYSVGNMFISLFWACGFRMVWIYTIFQVPRFHTLQMLYTTFPFSWAFTILCELILFVWAYKRLKKNQHSLQ